MFCLMEETVRDTGPAMHNKQNCRGRVGAFKAEVHLAPSTANRSNITRYGNCKQNSINI
jgi:hypothetical protein